MAISSTKGISRTPRKAACKHYYQFYKGPEDLFRITIPFLRLGLENREACLWVVSQVVGVLDAIHAFQREYDMSHFIENGQLLILPAERWYLNRGEFSEKDALERMRQFVEDKGRLGFLRFRIVKDVGTIDKHLWPKFRTYERKIHYWIRKQRMTVVCTFPAGHYSLVQTKEVVDTHDHVFCTKL